MCCYFWQNKAYMCHNNKIVLQGTRKHSIKLWYFDLNSKETTTAEEQLPKKDMRNSMKLANCIAPKTNAEKLTRFLYRACSFPCTQTIQCAVKQNHLATWPHINTTNVK